MFRVSCLGIWWHHDIWISEKWKFDYLKKWRVLVSQVLFFRYTKQTSKNVAGKTFKAIRWNKVVYVNNFHPGTAGLWNSFASECLTSGLGFKSRVKKHFILVLFLNSFPKYFSSFLCSCCFNSMPCSGCSALHEVNLNSRKMVGKFTFSGRVFH